MRIITVKDLIERLQAFHDQMVVIITAAADDQEFEIVDLQSQDKDRTLNIVISTKAEEDDEGDYEEI